MRNLLIFSLLLTPFVMGKFCTFKDQFSQSWDLSTAAKNHWSWTGKRDGNIETWYISICGPVSWCPTTDGTCGPSNQVCQTWRSVDPSDPSTYSAIVISDPSLVPNVSQIDGGVRLQYLNDLNGQPSQIDVLCPTDNHPDGTAGVPTKNSKGIFNIPLYANDGCGTQFKNITLDSITGNWDRVGCDNYNSCFGLFPQQYALSLNKANKNKFTFSPIGKSSDSSFDGVGSIDPPHNSIQVASVLYQPFGVVVCRGGIDKSDSFLKLQCETPTGAVGAIFKCSSGQAEESLTWLSSAESISSSLSSSFFVFIFLTERTLLF